jgi:hypothetical protein
MRSAVNAQQHIQVTGDFGLYTLLARIVPVYLVLLPVGIIIKVWLLGNSLEGTIGALLAGPIAISMFLGEFGRDRGYRKQGQLWASWGGAPTTQLLRHRNADVNPLIRARYHSKLRLLLPDLEVPTSEEEQRDPAAADHVYEACARFLIGRTRDRKQFSLIFKENVSYGFRRNLWGLKALGLSLALVGLFALALRAWLELPVISTDVVVGSVLTFVVILVWIFVVTPDWVRIPAEAYAARLLESCDQLEP